MEIIAGTTDFYLEKDTAVVIGKFDGVHLGHRRLLEEILNRKKNGLAACVFTFDPTPAVLFGLSDGKELTTREEKRRLFERLGIDILIEFPLTKETAATEPERFVTEILAKQMNTRFVAAGEDLSFGKNGAGNAELLEKMAPQLGFCVRTIEKIEVDGIEVSSTYIRKLVEEGRMEEAEKMLGMPYTLVGCVEHGNHIGHTLGFPTVNLLPPAGKLLPPNGVYYAAVRYNGKVYKAISNVGTKPTVSSEKRMGVESYLYDFHQDVYGKEATVCLRHYERPEQKFDSVESLKHQMQKDIQLGKQYFNFSG